MPAPPPTPARFAGWPPEAFAFFRTLEADNTKATWQAHRATYDTAVRGPMDALLAAVADEFGPLHVFRPHRDVRFSKDKTPYKTHIGAVGEGEGGEVVYVHLSADGLMAATGMYAMAPDQLTRHRSAVADDATGTPLVAIVEGLRAQGYEVGAVGALKTAPRGVPRDHPRIHLMRLKGLTVSRSWPVAPWMHTAKALTRITAAWRDAATLNAWLTRHVGPSELPPEDLW